jgi:hypothetical protein
MSSGKLIKNESIKGVKFVEDVPAYRFVAVAGFDDEDAIIKVGKCGANAAAYGVTPTDMTAGVVDEILIGNDAIIELELVGSITVGDEISSDANGKGYKAVYITATTATAGLSEAYINGIAEEDGVAGDVISVRLIAPYKKEL